MVENKSFIVQSFLRGDQPRGCFTTRFSPAIELKRKKFGKAEIFAEKIRIFNEFNNISDSLGNNCFIFSENSGKDWKTKILSNGNYSLQEICKEIEEFPEGRITFIPIEENLLEVSSGDLLIDFRKQGVFDCDGNLGTLLGFKEEIVFHGKKSIMPFHETKKILLMADVLGIYSESCIGEFELEEMNGEKAWFGIELKKITREIPSRTQRISQLEVCLKNEHGDYILPVRNWTCTLCLRLS